MKAFDLEAAKRGAAVVTRDGHDARIVCYDAQTNNNNNHLVALVKNDADREKVIVLREDGTYYANCDSPEDLFMKTTYHEGYTTVYRLDDGKISCIYVYPSEEGAKQHVNQLEDGTYITTIKVSWEE